MVNSYATFRAHRNDKPAQNARHSRARGITIKGTSKNSWWPHARRRSF